MGETEHPDDGEALIRQVYEEHGASLIAYARRITGDHATAEDIVQETLIRAWTHPEALRNGKGSVRGWLLTVTRNIATDRFRAKAARPAEVSVVTGPEPAAADPAENIVDSLAMLSVLDRLSPDHRAVLLELYYKGRSVVQAAEALGVPPGTVRSRTYYAMRALRGALGGLEYPTDGRLAAR